MILTFAVLGILLTGLTVGVAGMFPLYRQLKANELNGLVSLLDHRQLVVEQFLARTRDVTRQIVSRSQIRKKLVAYNRGEVTLPELVAFSRPKLEDALRESPAITGMVRLDANGAEVISIGSPGPAGTWPRLSATGNAPRMSGPVTVDGQPRLVVSMPIVARDGSHQGTDILFFSLDGLAKLLGNRSGLGATGSFWLLRKLGGNWKAFLNAGSGRPPAVPEDFTLPSGGHAVLDDGRDGLVSAAVSLSVPGWLLLETRDADELYASLLPRVMPVALGLLTLILRGASGVWLFLRPLSGRVVVQAGTLHAEMERRQRSEEEVRLLLESTGEGLYGIDREGRCVMCNPSAASQLGFPGPEALIGQSMHQLTHHSRSDGSAFPLDECPVHASVERGEPVEMAEDTFWRRDGSPFPVEYRSFPMLRDGEVVGAVVSFADITARKRDQEHLRKLSQAVEQSPAAVVITDAEGRIEYINHSFEEMSGYQAGEALGATPRLLKSGRMPDGFYRDLWETVRSGRQWYGEVVNRRKDGELYWVASSVSPIRDSAGRITHMVGVQEDVTVRKNYEEQLLHQANYDGLTGLPNRILALDRLSQALVRDQREGSMVALLFVDLDNFKQVNDSLGHEAGDTLLRATAERLVASVREGDTVARYSGDEFVVILPDMEEPQQTERVIKKILDAFRKPFSHDGHELFATTSIGVCVFPDDGDDPNMLLRNADAAMHRAKERGRNTSAFFEPGMNERAVHRLELEGLLRHALERNELFLLYQPIVELGAEGVTVGVEALLRWQSPQLGLVGPDDFIPLAEDTGTIVPIGAWVFEQVCRQMSEWHRAGIVLRHVAVNVSPRQLRDPGFVELVRRIMGNCKLAGSSLQIEVTERLLMENVPEAKRILDELKGLGVSLSMDDFGTGYSSLGYLKGFPFDVLKIDRSFVRDIPGDADDAALAGAIIAMARSLGLKVVGEGVETREQLQFLTDHGCEMAQGFYFSRPVEPAAIAAMLSPKS